MKTNLLKFVSIGFFCLVIFGCQSNEPNKTNSDVAESGNSPKISSNSKPNFVAFANANVNSNRKTETADDLPKRISFNKGTNRVAVNAMLASGTAQKFIVSAKNGQTMTVETSSKEISISLIKGRSETTEDFGFLNAELQADDDYVFEVRNSTKKEIKTSVKVTIKDDDEEN